MFDRIGGRSPFARVFKAALEEARRRGDRRLGTEHLLLGLLHDPATTPAQALGVGLDGARAALESLDRAALTSVGVDPDAYRPTWPVPTSKHPPVSVSALTTGARAAVNHAIKSTRGARADAPEHLLLALLSCERPDPASALLTELGVDRTAARARIAVRPAE